MSAIETELPELVRRRTTQLAQPQPRLSKA